MIHKLFTLPIKGLLIIGEKIDDEVKRDLYDLQKIQRELLQLHLEFEQGKIEEDLYLEREEALMERYQIAKQMEMGNMGGDR